jgi:hypothetical protein
MKRHIFRLSGHYLAFMDAENIFSRDGHYLGWIESNFAWDAAGQFRGELQQIGGHLYILKDMYALPPLPKPPKLNPLPVVSIPAPPANIPPITPPKIGWVDGFGEK